MDRSRTVKNRKVSIVSSYRHYDTSSEGKELNFASVHYIYRRRRRVVTFASVTAAITKIGTKGDFIIRDQEMSQTNTEYDLTPVANTKYSFNKLLTLASQRRKKKTLIIIHMRSVCQIVFYIKYMIFYLNKNPKKLTI